MGGLRKAELMVDGERIVDRLCALLAPRCASIWLSVREPAPWSGLPWIIDEIGEGPLAGIATALRRLRVPRLLAVAADMPRIQPALLDRLIAAAESLPDAVAIVPRVRGFAEPLLAVYDQRAAPSMVAALMAGDASVSRWLAAESEVAYVEEGELRKADPQLLSFFSINTPADWDMA